VVGLGPQGRQRPVLIVEPLPGKWPASAEARGRLIEELLSLGAEHAITRGIRDVLFHRDLPVDVRHNAKIQREKLAVWAAQQLGEVAE
jgi:hypothetical protein